MSHWTKPDHVTFLGALALSIVNLFVLRFDVMLAVVLLMIIALVYDALEKR